MKSKNNHLVTKEMLEKYYGEEVESWFVVENDENLNEINNSFISVILLDRPDILPLKSYLRFLKLESII